MAEITASSAAELISALKSAQRGDTIFLASGTYSNVVLRDLNVSGVTVTSLDSSKPAILTDLSVRGSSGIEFKNLEFVAEYTSGSDKFNINSSSNIIFDRINVHGSLDGNPQNDTSAMIIRNSNDVIVRNSEFHELANAVTHLDSRNVTFEGNYFHDLRMDGIRGGGTSNLSIVNNYFTEFYPVPGDHPDAIQVWNTNTTSSAKNINISGNIIERGDGEPMQGIFVKAEQSGLPYYDLKIADNIVLGGLYNGIAIRGAVGALVEGNTVAGYGGMNSWIRLENIQGINIYDNESTDYQKDVNVTGKIAYDNIKISVPDDAGRELLNIWLHEHSVLSDALRALVGGELNSPQVPSEVPTPPSDVTSPPAPEPVPERPVGVEPIYSSTTVVMGEGDKAVYLTKTASADVYGNGLDNKIVGNKGDNVLDGGGGDDLLDWGAGGADKLIGGAGNDVYVVGPSTQVVEHAGGGIDTIMSMYAVKLQANVENLVLLNSGGASGTGNELANVITGNAGANVLDGAAGNDTIFGGAGKDVLIGGAGDDVIYGEAGGDYFRFNVGSGRDVIMDFGVGGDREGIDFMSYVKAGAKVIVADVEGGALVTFDANNSVLLAGVNSSSLEHTTSGLFIN